MTIDQVLKDIAESNQRNLDKFPQKDKKGSQSRTKKPSATIIFRKKKSQK
jgi:hypothetical protein